ncbi:MAG TPA: pitrilysin family protein, partial [Thermoanaerobaculia bacterium]|nr:pitrilysin family protein [Thermoanaerobaculia bacterium]
MINLEQYELGNGLRVVLNEDHSAPLVAINLWYHVGSKNERPGRTGFAHLFEHMLFSGSQNVGNNEHFRHVQSVGGVLNGTTFFDRTNYFETLPSNYLALGLWLESDRMGFFLPALTQEKLDIQREVVKEERRQRYDNVPYGTAFERMLRLAYNPEYPYHWPTIGSMEDL